MSEIPTATISRLVTYLRVLEQMEAQNLKTTSSTELAERSGGNPFQVRKDLAYFGRFGTRGMGYAVPVLKRELMRVLGLNQTWNVVVVGMGQLGQAIVGYPGASDYQFQYVGLFDFAPGVVGSEVRGLVVRPLNTLMEFVQTSTDRPNRVDMGFIAADPDHAQDAAQALVEAGVKGILNFAPTVIQPRQIERAGTHETAAEWQDVIIENVDFLAGMKRLAFYILNPHLRLTDSEESL